ncbi:MAG: NACHT domain-containing protein [Pseudonocardiaceae bacterium]
MARGVSYTDAVTLLGGRENRTVAALDRLVGGLLLVASAAGAGFALSLFDPKSELARLSGDLVSGLAGRLRGVSRLGRTERLAAAHAVIVLTAYFESLREASLPFDVKELKLTRAEQVAVATGGAAGPASVRALADALLRADVPMPAAQRPYELTLETVNGFYTHLSDEVCRFVAGVTVWDRLDDIHRQRFRDAVCRDVPARAVARYEELFRRLATDFPEVALWANLVDHQATRAEIRRVGIGLAGVQEVLAAISAGRVPDERRLALARAYQAALHRPVLASGEVPEELRIPLLAEAYVNPDFRAAQVQATERLAEERWWNEHPVRDDLEGFLLGHLTAPHATEAPLLVLGQPGSGKSLLTQVLAARLPPSEFLALRVALREVPADADPQAQIEHAIRTATGESMPWAALARSAGDALPVVLLDGFDELLQATGVSQSDYLEKIADFQRREADQGRPVVVLVTSRTAVADRARAAPGMVAVRLEPFRDDQIVRWLAVWNAANASGFAARDVRQLPAESVLAHAKLARQPLLLLMLALYDADGNPLQREDAALGQAELYERLLTQFAEREVRKTAAALSATQFERAVDRELLRLSVVAFATFNRGRQWVTETELDADLPALLVEPGDRQRPPSGLRAELTAAEVVIGRFFFVHEARATRDATRLATYEFLHTTFGEYLIGRLITRELDDLADTAARGTTRGRPAPLDDAFLHALLSFAPLTMRGTIVTFLAERLRMLPGTRREPLRDLLLSLFHHSLLPRHDTSYDSYEPDRISVPARHAAYSVNLALLAVLTAGEITEQQLFPGRADPVQDWRRLALLWRSQLPEEGWENLIRTLDLHRGWDGDRRIVRLRLSEATEHHTTHSDPYWTYNYGPGHKYRQREGWFGWTQSNYKDLQRQSNFLCDTTDDSIAHALEPFSGNLGNMITFFLGSVPGRSVSAANVLITLWLTASQEKSPDELAVAYDACLRIATNGFAPFDVDTRARFRDHFLRQLSADYHRLPSDWLQDTIEKIKKAGGSARMEGPELVRMANEILPELMAEDPPKPS